MELKATMDELFKNGNNFEFKCVDYSYKKEQKRFKKFKKEMDKRQSEYRKMTDLSNPVFRKPFNI